MKHILSLLLLLMCCVGYVSCGDDDAPLLGSKVPGQWVINQDGEEEGDTLGAQAQRSIDLINDNDRVQLCEIIHRSNLFKLSQMNWILSSKYQQNHLF